MRGKLKTHTHTNDTADRIIVFCMFNKPEER